MKNKRYGLLFVLLMLAAGLSMTGCIGWKSTWGKSPSTLRPSDGLMVNLMAPGLGVDPRRISFSWAVGNTRPSASQTWYRLLVSSSLKQSLAKQGDVWDSGRIRSASSIGVPYAAPPLSNAAIYYWRVQTGDSEGHSSLWSAPQLLVTAPDHEGNASWIGAHGGISNTVVYLRREIDLPDKPLERGIVFATWGSEFRLYVNDRLAGLMTSTAHYETNAIAFQTWDITAFLKPGRNCLALLGRGQTGIIQLLANFTDGTKISFGSDEHWMMLDGRPAYRNEHAGREGTCGGMGKNAVSYAYYEHLDARAMPRGWRQVGFDEKGWRPAIAHQSKKLLRPAQKTALVEEEVPPVVVTRRGTNTWFFDMGKEILGSPRLRLKGQAGNSLEVRLGEELHSDKRVRYEMRTGIAYQEWWTLSGQNDMLENLGLRAFRYAEIVAPIPLLDANIVGRAVHVAVDDRVSSFESASPELNRLWVLGKYTAKALSVDLWTDSEARERIAYAGDYYPAQVSAYVTSGEYTIPRYSLAYALYHPTWPTIYNGLLVCMFWRDYLYTGHPDLLQEHYPRLKALTREDEINAAGLIEQRGDMVGAILDWPASNDPASRSASGEDDGLVKCRIATGQNAVAFAAMRSMALIAAALGKQEDARHYTAMAAQVRTAVNRRLWDAVRGCYFDGVGTDHAAMHSTAYAAALGLALPEQRDAIVTFLADKGQVGGVFGAQFFFDALYALDAGDVAYGELMRTNTIRNWRHMLAIGATTTTEAWDPALKPNMTWSHLWGNAIPNIIACGIMGITPLEPGFKKIRIKPQPGALANARMDIPTVRGNVHVNFKQNERDGIFDLRIVIPANASAIVYVPDLGEKSPRLEWNGQPIEGKNIRRFIVVDNVGSGSHRFIRRH